MVADAPYWSNIHVGWAELRGKNELHTIFYFIVSFLGNKAYYYQKYMNILYLWGSKE